MPTAYSRVTVVNGARRVDLALPRALPISDVVPQLLRFCAPAEKPERPAAWTLGRVGGANLALAQSLGDAGVIDGEVLELRSAEAAPRPAYVEDVRDAIEDAVDSSGGQWRTHTTRDFVLIVAAVGAAATVALPFTRQPDDPAAIASGALLAALAVVAGWWGARRGHTVPAQLVLAAGCLWGGVAGWLAATTLGWTSTATLGAGVAVALLVAVVARVATPQATPHLSGLAVLAAGAGIVAGTAAALDVGAASVSDGMAPYRVVGVLAILMIGVLPRVSVSVGGLATADYRVRKATLITHEELTERVRQSTALLFGAVLGAAAVGGAAGVMLSRADSVWDRLLGLTVGLTLLLRSRVFSRILQMVPLRVAGCVVLATQIVEASSVEAVRPWFAVLVGVGAAGLVALSAVNLSDITRARVKRVLNWTESVIVIAMIALAAAGLGLYDLVADQMRP